MSHYIKVGNLKLDQDLMDVICPAAGFTPANICPAAGYVLDSGLPYEPPIEIPEPGDQEIILLCNNNATGNIGVRCTTSAGTWFAEVYTSSGDLIETTAAVASNAVLTVVLPQANLNSLYYIKYKLTTSGSQFRAFLVAAASGWTIDWQILQAKFKTPNLTSLASAFLRIYTIKSVEFYSSLDSLTSMASMFSYSGIENFTFPASLPALTTLASMFAYSQITKIADMTDCYMPELTTMQSFCDNCSNIQNVILPSDLPKLTTLQLAFRQSGLKSLKLPISTLPLLTSIANLCQNSKQLQGEVVIPEAILLNNISYAFDGCEKIETIRMTGTCNALTSNHASVINNCYSLKTFEFARTMDGLTSISIFYNCYALENIILPDSMQSASLGSPGSGFASNSTRLKSITGNGLNSTTNLVFQWQKANTLEEFDCPSLKVAQITLGYNLYGFKNKFKTINIDWANSYYNSGNNTLCADLDATELNRIFGLLPVVSGKIFIITGCTGADTCDTSIATAKGWTVL